MPYSISQIEKLYKNWYDPGALLSYDDQKFIWENAPLPELDEQLTETEQTITVNLTGSVISSGKLIENSEKTFNKLLKNSELKLCNYKTPPKIVAKYLEHIFGVWDQKPEHWLFIARRYTPKTINAVVRQINKRVERGEVSPIDNGAYFTSVIKHKHIKKMLRKGDRYGRV